MERRNYLEQDFPTALWLPFATHRSATHCREGQLIYLQDTSANCFYYLKSGKVKSFIQSEDGNERVLNIYNAGSIFGEASFFDEMPRVSSALAVEDCEVVSIDRIFVEEQFAKDPKLAMAMLKYLARTVRLLSSQLDEMAFRPVPQRVARYLLAHTNSKGEVVATQEEIASSVSASRITVSRVLSSFMKKHWLETKYGTILLKKTEELESFCEN